MTVPSRVCILGNSIPILMLPPRRMPEEKTYGELLRDRGYVVNICSKQGVIISDVYRYLEDEVLCHFPDYVILHFGIVEGIRRARPRYLQRFFSDNDWNNSIMDVGYRSPSQRTYRFILRKLYLYLIERSLYKFGISWRWLGPGDFRQIYLDLLRILFRETAVKKVILLGVTPLSETLEKRLPGSRASVEEYNKILQEIAEKVPDVRFIPTVPIQETHPSPDGTHLSSQGHALLASILMKEMVGERGQYTAWQDISKSLPIHQVYKKVIHNGREARKE